MIEEWYWKVANFMIRNYGYIFIITCTIFLVLNYKLNKRK